MTCEHGLTTKECYVCSSPKYGEKKMTTLKTLEMALEAYEVPLVEQLERVLKDARLVIDDADGMGTRFIPVGRMCHEAATALRQAKGEEHMTCPDCEYHKNRAARWRAEAYKLIGHEIELPWVGLNWDDLPEIYVGDKAFLHGAKWAEAKLKEKNA